VTQVALASGFASLRRFNAAFAERYRLKPSQLRREQPVAADGLNLRLNYRPPYDVAGVLRFFAQRQLTGVETVEGLELRRTLRVAQAGSLHSGWFSAHFVPERHEVALRIAASLTPVLGQVLQRVRQGFDLDADPSLIDPALAASLHLPAQPGLRVPNGFDGFETAVRVILGQQITVAAARTLAHRLIERFGEPVATPFAGLDRGFPTAQAIATADPETIGTLGIVRQRVRALQALAQAVHEGRIALHRGAPLQATLDALLALPGIGEWSAQLIAMRALAWPDAFPASDIGLLNALGTRNLREVQAQAEAWRPWRAYAVIRLWQKLEPTP